MQTTDKTHRQSCERNLWRYVASCKSNTVELEILQCDTWLRFIPCPRPDDRTAHSIHRLQPSYATSTLAPQQPLAQVIFPCPPLVAAFARSANASLRLCFASSTTPGSKRQHFPIPYAGCEAERREGRKGKKQDKDKTRLTGVGVPGEVPAPLHKGAAGVLARRHLVAADRADDGGVGQRGLGGYDAVGYVVVERLDARVRKVLSIDMWMGRGLAVCTLGGVYLEKRENRRCAPPA